MKANKSLRMQVLALAAVVTMLISSCNLKDNNPCANGSACGLTSPVTQIEQTIINAVDTNPCDNALSGGCK